MFLKRNINKLVLISSGNHTRAVDRSRTCALTMPRDVTKTLIGGGGGEVFIHIFMFCSTDFF